MSMVFAGSFVDPIKNDVGNNARKRMNPTTMQITLFFYEEVSIVFLLFSNGLGLSQLKRS
jgi:hypothetical protein